MKRLALNAIRVALLMLLVGSVSAAVRNADTQAISLTRQAQALIKSAADAPVRASNQFESRNRLLDSASELLSAIDNGTLTLSDAQHARLLSTVDQLEALPVDHSLYSTRAIAANGTISGSVTDAISGLPITTAGAVRIQAIDFSAQIAPSGAGVFNNVSIDALGNYTLTLPPGNYHLRTSSNTLGYINQAYGAGNCTDSFNCPRYVGTIVTVPDGGSVSGINFSMPPGASISGNVKRSDTMADVAGVFVYASNENRFGFAGGSTDASGNYTISGLPAGRYRVYATTGGTLPGFLHEVYNGVPCNDDDCIYVGGVSLITVSGTANTPGINFTLDPIAGSVSGIVTETGTGTPIADDGSNNAYAFLVSEDRATYLSVPLAVDGSYSFPSVRPGNYRLGASTRGHIGKVISGLAPIATRDCGDPVACDALEIGAVISVPASGNLTALNFSLDTGATFSGNVRAAVGLAPIANATVYVSSAVYGASAITDAAGNFTVRGLPPGVYYAYADAISQNYVPTWLGDVACRGFGCSQLGVPTTLTPGATVSGQQFNLPVGGTVSGMILDGTTGFAAPRQTRLELFKPTGETVAQVFNMGTAGYSAPGLQPGAYKAVFASSSVAGWIDTAFGGLPCPRGGCDLSLLPTVFVTAGATTSGIGGTLPRGPRISGRVTDAATGEPILSAAFGSTYSGLLAFNNNLSNYAGFAQIDGSGRYTSRTGFPPGAYFLSTFLLRNNFPIGGGYVDELYDNIPCPYGSCGLTSGNALNMAGTELTGYDIALSQGGKIAGTVTNAVGGAPLFGVQMRAFNAAGNLVALSNTNPNGNYVIEGLPTGNYFVTTQNSLGFQDQLFSGQTCEPFCNPVTGTAISVVANATTSGRNFALVQSVAVSGIVSDAGPAANVPVEIYGQIGNLLRSTVTNASGAYSFTDLAPGRFFVRTRSATGRTDDLYYQPGNPNNSVPTKPDCVGLACQVRRGTPIDVGAGGNFSTANLALAAPGIISGQVSNFATSNPMSGVSVQLLDARGAIVNTATTSAAGNFSFSALAAGDYFVVSRGTPGFIDLAYPNVPCPASCNGLVGSAITAIAGATVSGNNMALSSGASISGTVRNSANNLPIPGATVQVYNSTAVPVAQIATNPSGNYELSNVPNGNFFVRTQNSLGFINEVFNNHACGGYCDILNGDAVTISGGVPVGLIDFSIDAGGSISGQLSNSVSSAGIALAEVQAIDVNGLIASRTNTNASGNFTLGGLQPGNYKLRTSNTAGYVNQVYRTPTPLTCSPSPCLVSAGTAISVSGAVSGINMALTPGGTISGTAADLFNNPLPTGTAVLLDSNGIELFSNAIVNGLFEFNGLANGSYYVLIRNNSGLIDLLYPNVPCPAGACNITAVGTPIVLSAGRSSNSITSAANIDLRLPAGRAISGRVTRSGLAASGVTVYIFDSAGTVVASGISDGLGDYVTSGSLPAGSGNNYYAATASPTQRGAADGLVNKAWNNVPCMLDCGVSTIGTVIPLLSGVAPLAGINFDLQPGGGMVGTVRNSLGAPLALVTVQVFDSNARMVGTAQSDSLGNYRVDGLVPGTYHARTLNQLGLQDVLFGGALCGSGCNPVSSAPINVSGTNLTPAVDFSLPQQDAVFSNGFE